MSRTRLAMLAAALLAWGASCADEPDPMATVRDILELHGLWGRFPEERNDKQREQVVAPRILAERFEGLAQEDPFLGNLYVGFVVGALARHQNRLVLTAEGDTVLVQAGEARIVLRRFGDRYRVALSESIPQAIRDRALAEKERLLAPPQ